MFSRATRQRPCTGFFQIAVCTVRPFHSISRGSPTFTDSSRAMPIGSSLRSIFLSAWAALGNSELAIGTMGNHGLSRLKTKVLGIELYGYNIRLEGHQPGDTFHFRIGLAIRPCRQTCITNVVVAAHAFVRAKGLM